MGQSGVALNAAETIGQMLLTDLKSAHDRLLKELDGLDGLTRQAASAVSGYADVRWRLSRASRSRRKVIERAERDLEISAAVADLAELQRLRSEDIAAVRRSSDHIYRWNLAAVKSDWAGYCQASAVMRASMRRRIREEQEILYPLLSRY